MISATIIGNLGRDAETKTVGGTTVTSFSVASSTKVKGEDATNWVTCNYSVTSLVVERLLALAIALLNRLLLSHLSMTRMAETTIFRSEYNHVRSIRNSGQLHG